MKKIIALLILTLSCSSYNSNLINTEIYEKLNNEVYSINLPFQQFGRKATISIRDFRQSDSIILEIERAGDLYEHMSTIVFIVDKKVTVLNADKQSTKMVTINNRKSRVNTYRCIIEKSLVYKIAQSNTAFFVVNRDIYNFSDKHIRNIAFFANQVAMARNENVDFSAKYFE